MSELNVDALASAEAKAPRAKKIQTVEERAQLVEVAEELQIAGIITEDVAKVLPLAFDWNSEDEVKSVAKETIIAEFGGSDKFKDFVGEDLTKAQEKLNAIVRLIIALNSIKSFYARRANAPKRKVKTTQVMLNNQPHLVSVDYLAELTEQGVTGEDKRNALLSHADTSKVEMESL